MKHCEFFKTFLIVTGCLFLASCLRMEDTKGSLAAITPDPRIEGQWHATKWMDQEKPETATITLTKTERDGHTGYIFTSTDAEKQKDIESLWGMDFDGTRFFVSEFPVEGCKTCELLFYEVKDGLVYAYILKTPEAQAYMAKTYPENTKIVIQNSGEWSKDLAIKTLDDESKAILKNLATHPELWENAVILKKAD